VDVPAFDQFTFAPPLDVVEDDDELVLTAELPGMKP
jgi:HSP20 family molecular chaperone IbpA